MRRSLYRITVLLCTVILAACSGGGSGDELLDTSWSAPELVTITGYTGHAMEPFLSRDGNTLFFNNLNADYDPVTAAVNDTNIHYAGKISATEFVYAGELTGVNTDLDLVKNELEGVASVDVSLNFFYTDTINYSAGNLNTIYRGTLQISPTVEVINKVPVGNLKNDLTPSVFGELNMDVEVAADGSMLYFSDNVFSGGAVPDVSNIGMAVNDGLYNFSVLPNSTVLMANVNTSNLEYAPSISVDQLELFFTRCTSPCDNVNMMGIYISNRNSTSDAWSVPRRISSITGLIVEGPTVSSDGKSLYYHKKDSDGLHRIYRVTRP
ncbi:MAG: PD40 domain-containing protein [Nitrospirota bacterium]|nr:MAG: PD40 domain-containing protein [Nitrospirota bacterium]